ncbi:2-amino-4-hydroxy-6-hydroxymethyldihydropteridine diphosphokinase [Marichromatium bheemlicum]|uniref:2-amino-4-hydroxy-6-hydroxymethyldihydropteridine pyrophosphokinase n=1 Tax=Marichromatium bheemlicum TaxID=365339 RepID=A0ABX1I9A3_9GAMM|nr:2-amino-4-hydroxy-6-hydroxymethyldihydropteridine diphosphokinase [Marichromatium bheemlicum]NKN33544.1 2-amino-4-hydroxy-6-hydroxymethyldihydropteridine diphosphokinase [Marichromatium bheemlicum]
MPPEIPAYISIGSNIEPIRNIICSLELLQTIPKTTLTHRSSWYRTRPWGIENQAEFLNLVVEVETALDPETLLEHTQAIEQRLDRRRTLRNGPRTIDLDLLLHGDRVLSLPQLELPHPGLHLRDFMLIPLLEIAPEAHHPTLGPLQALRDAVSYRQIIERIPQPETERLAEPA